MRRLPVYVLVETSGGMRGERLEAVVNGLHVMVNTLRQDPFALESVHLSLVGFNKNPTLYFPLTDLESVQISDIDVAVSAPPHTGEAIDFVCERVSTEVIKGNESVKGDWKPMLFILTRGDPADKEMFRAAVHRAQNIGFASIVVCIAGSPKSIDEMRTLTDNIVRLDSADKATIMTFFKWVSSSIGSGPQEQVSDHGIQLPTPPPELHTLF